MSASAAPEGSNACYRAAVGVVSARIGACKGVLISGVGCACEVLEEHASQHRVCQLGSSARRQAEAVEKLGAHFGQQRPACKDS